MGASKERKKRIEDRQAGVESKWDVKEKEAVKAKKQKGKTYAVLGAIVIVSVLILFFSSNLFYRTFDAVKVGSVGYSAPEYKFYYYDTYSSIYNQYYQNYGEYAQYFMPDEDSLKESTFENMRQKTMLLDEAKKVGFERPEGTDDYIKENLDYVKEYAKENGFTGVNSYLSAYYGQGMNEKLFKKLLEDSYIAGMFYTEKYNEKTYTEAEIESYYGEKSKDFDKFTYYSKFFSGAAVEDNEETEEDETVSAEDAMKKAKADAEAYFETAYESFKESGTTTTNDGMNISTKYIDWLADSARVEGDKTLVEAEDGYYVVCFVSRDHNEYNLVNVRHILIAPETVSEDDFENDEDYKAAVAAANTAAKAKADELYSEWKTGDMSEDSFVALTEKYKDIAADSGLLENIYKGRMVAGFDDWCLDPARKDGDNDVVETTYGYHLVFFCGYGESYHQYIGEMYKRSDDFSAWVDEKLETGYDLKTTGMFKFAF